MPAWLGPAIKFGAPIVGSLFAGRGGGGGGDGAGPSQLDELTAYRNGGYADRGQRDAMARAADRMRGRGGFMGRAGSRAMDRAVQRMDTAAERTRNNPMLQNIGRELDLQNDLESQWRTPNIPGIANDPLDGVDFNVPGGEDIDRAVNSPWADNPEFDSTIQNDALDELRNLRTGNEGTLNTLDSRANSGDYLPPLEGDMDGQIREQATGLMRGRFGPPGSSTALMSAQGAGASADDLRSDMSPLSTFDADASFQRYMAGANDRMMQSLESGFKTLRNNAAGGNRLNSGFFDLDGGDLGRNIRRDFSNEIARAALDTNNQNLAARTSLTGFRVDENSAIRDARVRASIASADNATQASIANARNQLDAAGIDLDYIREGNRLAEGASDRARTDRDFRATRFDRQTNDLQELTRLRRGDAEFDARRLESVRRGQETDRDVRYTAQRDRTNRADERTRNDRSTFMDAAEARRRAWESGTDARFRAGQMRRQDRDFAEDVTRDRRNTYLDWLSGRTDRLVGMDNADRQRRADAQGRRENNRAQAWGTAADVVRTGIDAWSRRPSSGRSVGGGTRVRSGATFA